METSGNKWKQGETSGNKGNQGGKPIHYVIMHNGADQEQCVFEAVSLENPQKWRDHNHLCYANVMKYLEEVKSVIL